MMNSEYMTFKKFNKKIRWQDTGIWKFTSNLKTLSGFTLASQSHEAIASKRIFFPSKTDEFSDTFHQKSMSLKFEPPMFLKCSYHFGTQKRKSTWKSGRRPSCRPKLDVSPSDIFPQILHNFLVSLLCRVHSQHVPNLYLRQFLVQRCLLGNAWNLLAEFMTLAESNGP